MRYPECVTQALHTDRASWLVQRLHSRGTWGMCVCLWSRTCMQMKTPLLKKVRIASTQEDKRLYLYSSICEEYKYWPWNVFADTGLVLKAGMGQIESDENRRKKGLLCVCVHRGNGTRLWHCCMGWWKWIEMISKEKEKQEEESGVSVRTEDSWHYMGTSSQESRMDSPCGTV